MNDFEHPKSSEELNEQDFAGSESAEAETTPDNRNAETKVMPNTREAETDPEVLAQAKELDKMAGEVGEQLKDIDPSTLTPEDHANLESKITMIGGAIIAALGSGALEKLPFIDVLGLTGRIVLPPTLAIGTAWVAAFALAGYGIELFFTGVGEYMRKKENPNRFQRALGKFKGMGDNDLN